MTRRAMTGGEPNGVSWGQIQNDGTSDRPTESVLFQGGSLDVESHRRHPPVFFDPAFVENNEIASTAGDDVRVRAREDITNSGSITAFDDVEFVAPGGDIIGDPGVGWIGRNHGR